MRSSKKRILFVTPIEASFIKNDRTILNELGEVIELSIKWRKGWSQILAFAKQLVYYFFVVPKVDVIFVEFGGYWSLMPVLYARIYCKKSYIVLHGTDSCYIPEINYGYLGKFPIKYFCYYSYKFASTLLPVSRSLIRTNNTYACKEVLKNCNQGYKAFFPKLKTPVSVIHNGLDVKMWIDSNDLSVPRNEKVFVTVIGDSQFYRKGGDLIIEVARMLPDCTFIIVGMSVGTLKEAPPLNVKIVNRIPQGKLKEIFYSSRFYLQLSVFEGFGLSLCESMLCGCIPIGSSVNIIPDIIGDSGYLLYKYNTSKLYDLIKRVTKEDKIVLEGKSRLAIKRIKDKFALDKRTSGLYKIIYDND